MSDSYGLIDYMAIHAEVKRLQKQLDMYSILDEAYLELEGMGKEWVDNNWKALCATWAEHMLDPTNWGDE